MAPASEGQGDLPRKDGVMALLPKQGQRGPGDRALQVPCCPVFSAEQVWRAVRWHGVVDVVRWGGKGPEQAPKGAFVLWPLVSVFSQNWSCPGSLAKSP